MRDSGLKGGNITREALRAMIEKARAEKGTPTEKRPGKQGGGFAFALKGSKLIIEVDLDNVMPDQSATYEKKDKNGITKTHVRSSITIAETPSNAFGAGGQDIQLPRGKKGGFALRVWEKV